MELDPKRLELFRQMLPGLRRLAVLVNPARPLQPSPAQAIQVIAERLGLQTLLVGGMLKTGLPRWAVGDDRWLRKTPNPAKAVKVVTTPTA